MITTDELHALATITKKAAEQNLPANHITLSNYTDIGRSFLHVYVDTVAQIGAWCEAWDVTPALDVSTNPDGTVITRITIPFAGMAIDVNHHLRPVAVSA